MKTPSASLPNGGQLGDCTLLDELGRGAFKTVYRARNMQAARNGFPEMVAVCVPHCQDEEGREIMRNELRVASGLEHPGIVRQYQVDEDGGTLYAITELVEGETVAERLKRTGAFPLEGAVAFVRQLGEALDYAHDGMAIHRDIKPANIMLLSSKEEPDEQSRGESSTERIKILDFGLARLMRHSHYLAATRTGTISYMAPEQFEGATGFNADLWALGVMFFEMITNALPFSARDERTTMRDILYERPNLQVLEETGFDRRLCNVMRKIFEKDPEKRYAKAADFVSDLEAVLRHAVAVNEVEAEIEVLVKSHFPLVMIQSYEEERVLRALRRVRDSISAESPESAKELYIWSQTRGVRDRAGNPVLPGSAGDPVQALEFAIRGKEQGIIHVFLDVHRHLTPVTVRQIRDAIWMVKRRRKSMIFVGPVVSVPDEIAADATLMTFETPGMTEFRELIDSMAERFGAHAVVAETREKLARAVLGITYREAERVLERAVLKHGGLNDDCIGVAVNEKKQLIRKGGILEYRDPDAGFGEVGGLELLKHWFDGRKQAFASGGKRFGLPAPRGVVLAGVPGCGKSLSAKALAADWGVPFLRLDMGRIYTSLVGESESNLRRALKTAELVSPAVLWIDELEKAFSGLKNAHDSGVTQRLFGCFLSWLEDRRAPVFVVATANDITGLPPEFTRKGRFDEIFFIDLPNEQERCAIFNVQLSSFTTENNGCNSGDFDLNVLAEESADFSGAEIREVVISALYRAYDGGQRRVRQEDILHELQNTNPLARTKAEDIAKLRAWAGSNARLAQAH